MKRMHNAKPLSTFISDVESTVVRHANQVDTWTTKRVPQPEVTTEMLRHARRATRLNACRKICTFFLRDHPYVRMLISDVTFGAMDRLRLNNLVELYDRDWSTLHRGYLKLIELFQHYTVYPHLSVCLSVAASLRSAYGHFEIIGNENYFEPESARRLSDSEIVQRWRQRGGDCKDRRIAAT